MDLLALIAAEPTLLPLWAVLVFAAGMYPVGMLFSCTPCCGCSLCTEGTLPDTITVSFGGYSDQTPGPDLITLGFESCFGSSAAARVTAPGGDPDTDAGPISAVSLTGGGSGYAKLGRAAPTLTASGGSGTGATFTVTVEAAEDSCGLDYWKIKSVAASGGSGYVDGEQITISTDEGDTTEEGAVVRLQAPRAEPTVTANVGDLSGSGADLGVVLAKYSSYSGDLWGVESVTVNDGGSGYTDGESLSFTAGEDSFVESNAQATIRTERVEPSLTAAIQSSGTGATLSVSSLYETTSGWPPRKVWSLSGATVSITNAGSGYAQYDPITFTVTDGTEQSAGGGYVSAVDSNGAVLSVEVGGGEYYKDAGVIEDVSVIWYGGYWSPGVITGATVESGGIYYREDATLPPYVSPVTVTIDQQSPSAGTGAELAATVDDDTESPTFGQITSVTITNGGSDYLAWKWVSSDCCGHYMNGRSFVLRRGEAGGYRQTFGGPDIYFWNGGQPPPEGATGAVADISSECVYSHFMCGGWKVNTVNTGYGNPNGSRRIGQLIRVGYRGPNLPPIASVNSTNQAISNPIYFEPAFGFLLNQMRNAQSACSALFTTSTLIPNCGNFTFEGSDVHGRTISVVPGGTYDPENGAKIVDFEGGWPGILSGYESRGSTLTLLPLTPPYTSDGPECSFCCQGNEPVPLEISVTVTDSRVPDGDDFFSLSGTHVLRYAANDVRWTIRVRHPNKSWVFFDLAVRMDGDICAAASDGCDHCIKKCAVVVEAIPDPQHPLPLADSRACGITGLDPTKNCAAYCIDTPLCSPPSGTSFSFHKTTYAPPPVNADVCDGPAVITITVQ